MYPGSGNGPTETYMIPGSGSNPQMTWLPPPEVNYEQGLYHPAANYYGYYSTGVEQQIEWNDQHSFSLVDGQEVLYSGLQPESYPYVYYSPSYDYAQSSYNPYNPYIPGAVFGPDSPIESHQYFSNPSYQLPVPSPSYIPMVVQPSSDVLPNSSTPSLSGTGTSVTNRQAFAASKQTTSRISRSDSSLPVMAEMSTNVSSSKQSVITSGSISHMNQNGTSSSLMQATDQFSYGNVPYVQNPSILMSNNFPSNYGTAGRGWATVDQFRPRSQFNGTGKNGNQNPGILYEQIRGPRTNKLKGQWIPSISAQMSKAGVDAHKAIIIRADEYNKDDFRADFPDAKFFIIKSYSEDDVHKSIKYNVWSSTPSGNKRLDAAYEEAHRITAGKPRSCPIFLFFSVNASGQFCGVAEMIGHVDFHKDMDFWQQDKWTGSFPVKWHLIKDVANTSFRHILLENNENKPVTNSRDTQEVTFIPGMNMLNIFKNSPLKTSILDDFMFYEERQMIIQEEKSRFTGRTNIYLPAIVSASNPIVTTEQNDTADRSSEDTGQSSFMSDQSPKADAKQDINHSVTDSILHNHENEKSTSGESLISQQVISKPTASELSDDKGDVKGDQICNADVATSIIKMNSLSIGSEEDNSGTVVVKDSAETDIVTVGSVHIKVNGTVEPSSTVI